MIIPFYISTLTFYTVGVFGLLIPAMVETLPSAMTYVEAEKEALENLDSAALDNQLLSISNQIM